MARGADRACARRLRFRASVRAALGVSCRRSSRTRRRAGDALPATGEWWLAFNDRTLNELQAQVDAANPDLAAAVAANDAAVARANAALSSAYPQIDANPHFLANKQSANRPLRSANQPTYYGDNLIGAQTAYEVDIWGRVRDLVASANANAEASADALADARLELHAELARDYVNLRGFDDQAKLLSDTIGIYRSALKAHPGSARGEYRLAGRRRPRTSPTELRRSAIVRANAQSRHAREFDCGAHRQGRGVIFGITVFEPASVAKAARAQCPRTCCAAGRTSRKPNGRPPQRAKLIGASRANFFPKFTFLALGGTQDTSSGCSRRSIFSGSVGPSIDFPLFDAGLRQAQLQIAKAQFTEAAESYRATVLRALKEVQDELSSLRWLAQEYKETTTAATAARKAADLSLDPVPRRRVFVSRRGDGAKRRARCGASGDRVAYPPVGRRHRPYARAGRRLDRAARAARQTNTYGISRAIAHEASYA